MCIAIYKDAKSAPVKRKTLQTCFQNNSDGAGYAWWDRKKKLWIVRKGLMTFSAFWKSFNSHGFQKKDTYICHFRIGTSGNKRGADCTHPFLITKDCEEMRQTKFESTSIAVHNGVHGPGEGTISDTMLAVSKFIWPLYPVINDKERGDAALEILADCLKVHGNRWLITDGFEVTLIGNWVTDEETGVRYSNQGYKETKWINPTQRRRPLHTPAASQTRNTSTSTAEAGKDIIRCWNNGKTSKYLTKAGEWNWFAWNADYEEQMAGMQIVQTELEAQNKETAETTAPNENEEFVSPQLTCAYKEVPVSIQGLVDSNGDVVWDGDYDPSDDLLICPNCKEDKYIVDPRYHYGEEVKVFVADSICQKCGCLFNDDDGTIMGYDFELRKEYQKNAVSDE